MTTSALYLQRTRIILASTLAALLAAGSPGLVASPAEAADTTVIDVPAPFLHNFSLSRESRFSDAPLLLPRSTTRVTFDLPDPDFVLDELTFRVYGADFESTGVATLDSTAHTASIDLPADFFEIRDGHTPLKQVDFTQNSSGELVGVPTADDYYGIDLTGSGTLAAPNPFFVTEFVGPPDRASNFHITLDLKATASTEQTTAAIDLRFPGVIDEEPSFFHADWRAAPGVATIGVGDTLIFRAEAGFFSERLVGKVDPAPVAVLAYSEPLEGAGEIALPTVVSPDGSELTVTIPPSVSTYQYGAEPRIEVVKAEGLESAGITAFVVPVAIAGTPTLPVAPGKPVAAVEFDGIVIEWPRAEVVSQQTEYLVRVYEDGVLTDEFLNGSVVFASARIQNPTPGVEYTFDVAGVNQNGVGAASPRSEPVTFNADTTAPTVVATVPTSGARSVDASAPITVQLDEPILFPADRPQLTLRRAGEVSTVPFVGYDFDTRTLTFQGEPLATDARYRATLDGVTDLVGNALGAAGWTFVTGPAPTVVGVSPAAGSTVRRDRSVTVRFDEAIIGASPKTAYIVNLKTGKRVPALVQRNDPRTRLVIDPTERLAPNTRYRVTLTGGPLALRDRAGNPLTTQRWTFSTSSRG